MRQFICWMFVLPFWMQCSTPEPEVSKKHIFYLHGRIIELQGAKAVHPTYGAYQFDAIIDSLKKLDAIVYDDLRPADVDFQNYCTKVSVQIDSLINSGVPSKYISVVGASKGAVMAMQIADQNVNPINYILLAANNDYIETENSWNLHGRILGFYEKSDTLAGKDYKYWIDTSTNAVSFDQIELNTGLGHGFLYQPLPVWLEPIKQFIQI